MGGPANIPISELHAYCGLYGIRSQDDIDDLLFIIAAMDSAWLEAVAKKA